MHSLTQSLLKPKDVCAHALVMAAWRLCEPLPAYEYDSAYTVLAKVLLAMPRSSGTVNAEEVKSVPILGRLMNSYSHVRETFEHALQRLRLGTTLRQITLSCARCSSHYSRCSTRMSDFQKMDCTVQSRSAPPGILGGLSRTTQSYKVYHGHATWVGQ
jgi:hypothetical protein